MEIQRGMVRNSTCTLYYLSYITYLISSFLIVHLPTCVETPKPKVTRAKKAASDSTASAADAKPKKATTTKAKKVGADVPVPEDTPAVKKTAARKTSTTKAKAAPSVGEAKPKKGKKAAEAPAAVEIAVTPEPVADDISASLPISGIKTNSKLEAALDSDEDLDLKEFLGEDFLSDDLDSLLPNLDEDLANLEANLGELGDFGFDFMDEDSMSLERIGGSQIPITDSDLDETLRSIESGNFDIDDFLPSDDDEEEDDDDDELEDLEVDPEVALGRGKSRSRLSATRSKASSTKQKVGPQASLRRVGTVDDDDEVDPLEEESDLLDDEELALELGGDFEDDLMIDVRILSNAVCATSLFFPLKTTTSLRSSVVHTDMIIWRSLLRC
jgi:hypothetical protein